MSISPNLKIKIKCNREDFLNLFRRYYDKINNRETLTRLWTQVVEGDGIYEDKDVLTEFTFHYPVDSETFLSQLTESFHFLEKERLDSIEAEFKAYILIFIYFSMKGIYRVTPKATALASHLYLEILYVPDYGKYYYYSSIYRETLNSVVSILKEDIIHEDIRMNMIILLKKYYLREYMKLGANDFMATTNCLTASLLVSLREMPAHLMDLDPIPKFCLTTLREQIQTEKDCDRLQDFFDSIFRCYRAEVMDNVPCKKSAVTILALFIDEIQRGLGWSVNDFNSSFCRLLGRPGPLLYTEMSFLVKNFKPMSYKHVLVQMESSLLSRNHKSYYVNSIKLACCLIENPPDNLETDLIHALSALLVSVINHLANIDKNVSGAAQETLTKLSQGKNLLLEKLVEHMMGTLISCEAILHCIIRTCDPRWGISSKNYNYLVITSKLLILCKKIDSDLIFRTYEKICNECTPFTFKPALPHLSRLFYVLAQRYEIENAEIILNLIVKMGLYGTDKYSKDFLDHIYSNLLEPAVYDDKRYPNTLFGNIFLTDHFDYETVLCRCRHRMRVEHVRKVITHMQYTHHGCAIFLCCLLEYVPYDNPTQLTKYFVENFQQISTRPIMSPLALALKKMLLRNGNLNGVDVPQLDVLQSLIIDALEEQNLIIPSIRMSYELYKQIKVNLRIETDQSMMDNLYDTAVKKACEAMKNQKSNDGTTIMFLTELSTVMQKLPNEEFFELLGTYFESPLFPMDTADLIPMLNAITQMALMKRSMMPSAVAYLRKSLTTSSPPVKVSAFKLMHSICLEITHEFEEILAIAFKEVVRGDPCMVRLSLSILEECIHNDYVRLNSEQFFKFVYNIGCRPLHFYNKAILMKRFILSNQNDIAKYFVQVIMFIHTYCKFPMYPIPSHFDDDLAHIRLRLDNPEAIPTFLFNNLSIRNKINVLAEICTIFDELRKGHWKIEDDFNAVMNQLLSVVKLINPNDIQPPNCVHVCKIIEKQIVTLDVRTKTQCNYKEYEQQIKKITMSLLRLLFNENKALSEECQYDLFRSIVYWVDFIKDEIIHYVHVERGTEFKTYFSKFLQFFNKNERKIMNKA